VSEQTFTVEQVQEWRSTKGYGWNGYRANDPVYGIEAYFAQQATTAGVERCEVIKDSYGLSYRRGASTHGLNIALSDPDWIEAEWANGDRTCSIRRLGAQGEPAEQPVALWFKTEGRS